MPGFTGSARAIVVSAIFLGLSCKHIDRKSMRPKGSELKDFPQSRMLDEKEVQREFMKTSNFMDRARETLRTADLNLEKARKIINEDLANQDKVDGTKREVSDYLQCLSDGKSRADCGTKSSLPKSATAYLERAVNGYYEIVAAFSPPVLIKGADEAIQLKYAEVIADENQVPKNIFIVRDVNLVEGKSPSEEFWSKIIDQQCAGYMSLLVHDLCVDQLLAVNLYNQSYAHLEAAFKNTDPIAIDAEINAYLRFFELGDQKIGQISNILGFAHLKLTSLARGMLDSSSIQRVSSLAVVGAPEQFKDKLSVAWYRYKEAASSSANKRVEIINQRLQANATEDNLRKVRNDIESATQSATLTANEEQYLTQENDFQRNRGEKLVEANRVLKMNFSSSFQSVFGASGSSTLSASELITDKSVVPNGQLTKIAIPNSFDKGAIQIMASPTAKYRANGIYFNRTPNLNVFKLKVSCCKAVSTVVNKVADKGKEIVKKSLPRGTVDAVQTKVFNRINEVGRNIDKSIFMPITAEVKRIPKNVKNGFGIGELLSPDPRPNIPPHPKNAFLNPDQVRAEIGHVWRLDTDANGYVIGYSAGRNVGTGKSTGRSNSRSTSTSVGSFFGYSSSGSNGESAGESESKGSSVSFSGQTGFYDNTAEVPGMRVGMLIGRFADCAGGSKSAPFAVGISNVVQFDRSQNNCSSIELFINDNLGGASQNCSDGKLCGSSDPLSLQLQFMQDKEDIYNKLMVVFNQPEFQRVMESSSRTGDAIGNAWRIFESKAKEAGLDPAAVTRFRPLVEQTISVKVNDLAIEHLVLDQTRMDLEVNRVRLQKEILRSQIVILDENLRAHEDTRNLQAQISDMLQEQSSLYDGIRDFYADELAYWYNTYRASALYHDPNSSIPDVFSDLRRNEDALAEDLENEPQGAKDLLVSFFKKVQMEKTLEGIENKIFVNNLLNQNGTGHCYVSFSDFNMKSGEIINLPLVASAVKGQANYNENLAKEISVNRNKVAEKYYRLRFSTDPSNVSSYTDAGQGGKPDGSTALMRCMTAKDFGMDKLIGVAVTYKFKKNATMTEDHDGAFVMHDPLMYGTVGNYGGERIYRMIDNSIPDGFWGGSFASAGSKLAVVPMFQESAIQEACKTSLGTPEWKNFPRCASQLLGVAITDTTVEAQGVLKSFFNSYLGGTWDIYFPEEGWKEWRENLEDLKFHMYFKLRTSKNAG